MRCALYILSGVAIFIVALVSCTGNNSKGDNAHSIPEDYEAALLFLDQYVADSGKTVWDIYEPMPDNDCVKLVVNAPYGSLRQAFMDSNYLHYAAGEALGIEPLVHDEVTWPLKRPLEKIRSNEYYYVDELQYSYPYLVPEGRELLDEIGRRFYDTLQNRGGGPYRLKVTSLLRTNHSIAKLRRVNRASVDSSAHLFGTTFDISYTNFPYSGGNPHRSQEDLKNLLSEILYELRNDNRCYVIYERKPGCFHITVRGSQEKS